MSQTREAASYGELDKYIDSLPNRQGALIPVLHKAQDVFGYLPAEVQKHVAAKLDIPASKVYGVVTFYSFFTMTKKGKYRVSICMGTACFVRGAQDIVDEFVQQANKDRNIVQAKVSTAVELIEEEKSAIEQLLAKITGKKVQSSFVVEPSLVGGVLVHIGDKVIDGSIKARLDNMRETLRKIS